MATTASSLTAASPKIARRQDRTRRRIVEISAAKFAARGYENVSVEEIIETADIARSSFYRFFSSREDVLANVIRPVFEQGIAAMKAIDPDAAPEHIMQAIFEVYLTLWRADADALRVSTRTGGAHFRLFKDLHGAYRQCVDRLLKRVEAAGALLNGSADYTSRLLARSAVAVLEVYANDPDRDALFHKTMRGFLLARA